MGFRMLMCISLCIFIIKNKKFDWRSQNTLDIIPVTETHNQNLQAKL